MSSASLPSMASIGRLITIADGPLNVELLPELGARLHRVRVFGHDLLRTPGDPLEHLSDPFMWGSYVMAPWCNRIDPVPTVVGDAVVRVQSNSPDGTALHGQVYLAPWQERADATYVVRGGGNGWPWPYETTLRVTASNASTTGATLTLEQVLTNLADQPMPGGLGIHPWFRGPLEVRIAADYVLPSNLSADDPIQPVSGDFDLRSMRVMPTGLDAAWLDPGYPPAQLRWPDLGVQATLEVWSDSGVCIVAASPTGTGAVAIEPETHAPQGLRRLLGGTSHGLTWLPPSGSMRLTTRMIFERAG